MSHTQDLQTPQPPVAGARAPQVADPQVPNIPIPHMGTSTVKSPPSSTQPQAQPQAQAQPQEPKTPSMPPLPEGVSQEAVDAAIRQVEQTGKTDGIPPQVLAAACAQIEAHAQAHGIDLGPPNSTQEPVRAPGPSNYVEAAVMDKQTTFQTFHQQRDQLKSAVAEQREAARKPYQEALANAQNAAAPHDLSASDPKTIAALAEALRELDPNTLALINAMGMLANTPGVLKSVVWLEIIRAMRALIADETKHQLASHQTPQQGHPPHTPQKYTS